MGMLTYWRIVISFPAIGYPTSLSNNLLRHSRHNIEDFSGTVDEGQTNIPIYYCLSHKRAIANFWEDGGMNLPRLASVKHGTRPHSPHPPVIAIASSHPPHHASPTFQSGMSMPFPPLPAIASSTMCDDDASGMAVVATHVRFRLRNRRRHQCQCHSKPSQG